MFGLPLLGLLAVRYGMIVRDVGAGNTFYRIWYVAGAVLILQGPMLGLRLWERVPVLVRWILFSVVAIGLVAYAALLLRIRAEFESDSRDVDCLIVLGAQMKESGPSLVLLYRLETAEAYLKEHPNTKCIVSGGQGANEPVSEAEGMRDYLVAHGIASSRILLEDRSTDTSENLRFSKELLPSPDVSVGIVTNNFHMYRALGIAGRCGYQNVSGITAPSTQKYLLHNLTRETAGILKDVLQGNMSLH